MSEPKNILITGATGFVGACLVRRLAEDKNRGIHIILRQTSDIWRIKDIFNKVNPYYADLTNLHKIKIIIEKIRPSIIYHLATHGAYSFQNIPKSIFETNILGTLNLLDACAMVGFDAFVNTGSSSEYGTKFKRMSEDDLIEPNSYYGVSKASQTLLCQYFAKKNNLPIVNLRLFSPYGYYEEPTRLIPTIINSCLEGKDLNLVSPKIARDFIFIDDVIDVYLKVANLARGLGGETLNIANGKQHTLEDVVSLVLNITGSKVRARWGAMPPRSYDTDTWQADISKAKTLLKWQPKFNLEEGLRKTVLWFKKNKIKFKEKYAVTPPD